MFLRIRAAVVLCLLAGRAPQAQAQKAPDDERKRVDAKAAEQQEAGRLDLALETYRAFAAKYPSDAGACGTVPALLLRPIWNEKARFEEGSAAFEKCMLLEPGNAIAHQGLAIMYWEKAYKDTLLIDEKKTEYADAGLRHVNQALSIKPRLIDGLVYKGLLLRIKAATTASPDDRTAFLKEAEQLQARALELKKSGEGEMSPYARLAPPPPPPPPPPPLGGVTGGVPSGVVGGVVGGIVGDRPAAPPPPNAIRITGSMKAPVQRKHVNPVYPEIAKAARVQGVVILECTISPEGKVVDMRVMRGIHLLDAAALAAVGQWEYSPTLLKGVPVPVIMTVTVNFTLR